MELIKPGKPGCFSRPFPWPTRSIRSPTALRFQTETPGLLPTPPSEFFEALHHKIHSPVCQFPLDAIPIMPIQILKKFGEFIFSSHFVLI